VSAMEVGTIILLEICAAHESLRGPKRRFAAPQRYVSNWGYSGPAWCMLETIQLTCSVLSCSPSKTATAIVAWVTPGI
jgi:hypothetical protein